MVVAGAPVGRRPQRLAVPIPVPQRPRHAGDTGRCAWPRRCLIRADAQLAELADDQRVEVSKVSLSRISTRSITRTKASRPGPRLLVPTEREGEVPHAGRRRTQVRSSQRRHGYAQRSRSSLRS